jgi:predicted TIM-barrel enzyme
MRGTQAPAVTPAMFKEVFEDSRAGQIVLESLIQRFAQDAVTDGGIDAVLKTYQRTGQRRVLDYIVTQINRANNVPDTQGENDE